MAASAIVTDTEGHLLAVDVDRADIQIHGFIKRPDQGCGFTVVPLRWTVERTLRLARPLPRCRRLGKDFSRRPSPVLSLGFW